MTTTTAASTIVALRRGRDDPKVNATMEQQRQSLMLILEIGEKLFGLEGLSGPITPGSTRVPGRPTKARAFGLFRKRYIQKEDADE